MKAMKKGFLGLALAGAILLPGTAAADSYLGVRVGSYFPTSSEISDKLGANWYTFGISGVTTERPDGLEFNYDWNLINRDRGGNHIFIVSPTFGIKYGLSGPESETQPYVAVRAGLAYIDYGITRDSGQRFSAKRVGYNTNAEIGINLNQNVNLALRYDFFSEFDEFSFDGFTVELSYGLVQY